MSRKLRSAARSWTAHEIPEPVVVPEIKLPVEEEPETVEETPAAEDTDSDEEDEIPLPIPEMPKKKRGKKIIVSLIALLLLAALGCGGKYYYDNYYLVPVNSIVLNGDADEITAQVDVAFDEAMLTAVCTDTYGNTVTAPVQQGVAQFTGLKAGTQYTVTLTVDGFYKLCGNNSASFTTAGQTTIVSISAVTGPENGSVILSFTVDGTDPENWTVEYTADGEEEAQTLDFTGHVVTITGLKVDTNYTFKLRPTEASEVAVVGTDTMGFTTSKLIQAQNVSIAAFLDGVMNIRWDAPADSQVAEWTVRCTDGGDYDQTLVVADCTAQFSGVEEGKTYTVEILAQGMTQSVRAELSLKQTTVSNVSCTPMGTSALRVTWEYEGEAPENRWTVTYSINGGEAKTIISNTNVADLSPLIPGASYEVSVAGMSATYQAPAADRFEAFGISADDITGSLCVTPGTSNWDHSHVETYTKDFSAGKSVSAVVYINTKVEEFESADVDVLYIIRDSKGKVIPELASVKTMNWATMWKDRYFYLTVPKAPGEAGAYTLHRQRSRFAYR